MIGVHYTSVKTFRSTSRVFGVQVAVSHWLRAWFRYGTEEKFHFLIGDQADWEEVQDEARQVKIDPKRVVGLDRRFVAENYPQLSTVFRPNPDSHNLLWQREQLDPGFAFCGLAHAISGTEAGKLLEQYCLAPSHETDAIICPSRAIGSAIRAFWDLYGTYLEERFGAKYRCPVQLPVMPLGIDVAEFEAITNPTLRATQRATLNIRDDDIVLLWVGRLSSAIKAHPLPMFQAAEEAAKVTGVAIHLVMVGYFMPEEAETQFRKLASDICQTANVIFVPSNDPRFPNGLWASGDIFLSLIDNMQESFGLTPLEAMAAGLPRVMSNWDGYRDSVTHGDDGFLVSTVQPPPGNGAELSHLLLNEREMYGGFLAKTALSVAVDWKAAADIIALLVRDPEKRRTVAARAKARVNATYDWRHIIPLYENLWREMEEKRAYSLKAAGGSSAKRWTSILPQAPDPFTMYASFPSETLAEQDLLHMAATPEMVRRLWQHEVNVLALDVMMPAEEVTKILALVQKRPTTTIGDVLRVFPAGAAASVWRTIAWLIKLGIFARTAA